MRDDIYTEIVINVSIRKNDNEDKIRKTALDVLKKLGGHERDVLWYSPDREHPYMNHHLYPELEPVWRLRFITKNIKNRHRKIFKKLQQQFPNRNIYCPYREDGWRLLLTRLEKCVFIVRNFTNDINVQRLNEEEKKIFQKVKEKYDFAFESNDSRDIRHSIQKLMRKKGLSGLVKQFNIVFYLKKLENNPEINTSEVQKAVSNILEILNTELFISQFEWTYKDINKFWKQKFGWHLFRKNDIVDFLKIPKGNEEFDSQIKYLHKILVESLNNKDLKQNLKTLGVTDTELKDKEGKMKKSIALLELWITKKLKKDNLEIADFLRLLHDLRGKVSHSLKTDGLSKEGAFKKIVKFCKKKQSINKPSHIRSEVFKAILKTSEALLERILYSSIN